MTTSREKFERHLEAHHPSLHYLLHLTPSELSRDLGRVEIQKMWVLWQAAYAAGQSHAMVLT